MLRLLVSIYVCASILGGTAYAQSVGATYGDSPKVDTRLWGEYKVASGKIVDKYAIGPRLRDIQKLEERTEEVYVEGDEVRGGLVFFYDEERSERDRQLKRKRKKAN